MNAEPKPLTKSERDALMRHIGGWKFERQGLANAEDAFMTEVSRIVAAREAAARQEAEDDPAHARMYRALVERAERAEAKLARVEALLAEMDNEANDYSASDATNPYDKGAERDEEGGR